MGLPQPVGGPLRPGGPTDHAAEARTTTPSSLFEEGRGRFRRRVPKDPRPVLELLPPATPASRPSTDGSSRDVRDYHFPGA
ncbi:hypothetical protein QNO09_03960 [Streptomyces sp. 378]|uniref:hypothetical protein n=1 Tax=Streptomyces sp. 378 TaxID=3049412 RepID=UPI0024C32CE2|nr:hypothetical protein [Streptomyces sp. 378]MDK1342479.1 hypothetical protein [Streptomyces sp. 378]